MSPKVPEVARLSEATVQKVAAGEVTTPRQRSKAGAIVGELTVTTVRRDVWERAVALASDKRNIQIISAEEVVVWNHGPPWPEPPRPSRGEGEPESLA